MFNSLPIAKLQTLPLTLGGMPCHHNSRTLREQHLFKRKRVLLRNISSSDESSVCPPSMAEVIQTKMNISGPKSQTRSPILSDYFALNCKGKLHSFQVNDRSTTVTVTAICHQHDQARIGRDRNERKRDPHLCHCIPLSLERPKAPCKSKYRNKLQRSILSPHSSPPCANETCSFLSGCAALTHQQNITRCNSRREHERHFSRTQARADIFQSEKVKGGKGYH